MYACQRCTQEFQNAEDGEMWIDVEVGMTLCGTCVKDLVEGDLCDDVQ